MFSQLMWWCALCVCVLSTRSVFSSDLPPSLLASKADGGGTIGLFDRYEPPFLENIERISTTFNPVAYELDEGYFPDGAETAPDAVFRDVCQVEDSFTTSPPEIVSLDVPVSIAPELLPQNDYIHARQDTWSTFGHGMSFGEFARNDIKTAFFTIDDDFWALWKPRNVLFVGAGLGLGIGLRQAVDDDTRGYIHRHPKRWSSFTETLGIMGNTEYQIAAIAALYGYSFRTENEELMEFTQLLGRTYTLTALATVTVKAIANTDRPSVQWMNGQFGFPSAHSSTSFAIAATIEEYYGPRVGIPAYILAGLIGWSRIDEQDHDVSDVVFGAFLGYTIAKSISGHQLRGDSRIRFFPWANPNQGSYGTMFEVEF